MVNCRDQALLLIDQIRNHLHKYQLMAGQFIRRPAVYFEEWDDPMISAIQWVSELIELCGGDDIAIEMRGGSLAKERFITLEKIEQKDPDIFLACWCGKQVKIELIRQREGLKSIKAIQKGYIYDLDPTIFLQPGPAALLDGPPILWKIFNEWNNLF